MKSNLFYNIENSLVEFNKKMFFENISNKKEKPKNHPDLNNFVPDLFLFFKKASKSLEFVQKFPFQKETLDFKFKILEQLSKFNFNPECFNINKNEFFSIKNFIKCKPFKICEADKNIGLVIVSNDLYLNLCKEHLNNVENFENLNENPLDDTQNTIKITLIELFLNRHISNRLFKSLFIDCAKLGGFRILPKLHKNKFSTRPIINNINHPTSNLSLLIDFLLQPYVKTSDSYIQDSQNLIQKLNSVRLPSDVQLHSLDFESLYSNIDLKHALEVITEFMKDKINNEHINIIGFHSALKLIFENNVFMFDKNYFRQIKGIAMGTKCGPSVANIYISCLERKFLTIHKPIVYYRFIDDIFLITKKNFNLKFLLENFGYLKLNVCSDEIVNFLDLNISYCKLTQKLIFSLYLKPTNTFCYLLIDSNHPTFIFENIPKSLFIRIRRICTKFCDFLFFSNKLFFQLISRGYDCLKLNKILNTVSNVDRKSLIPYKHKNFQDFDNSIIFKTPFDKNFINLKEVIVSSFKNLQLDYKNIDCKRIFNVFQIQNNIGSLLVHNKTSFNFNFKSNSYKKCNLSNCSICSFSNSLKFLNLNSLYLPILTNASCISTKVVYILHCNKCNSFYIGETSRTVKDRISEHLGDINYFRPYEKRVTPISKHFNLFDHSLSNFSFVVFDKDLDDDLRLNLEAQLIQLFLRLKIKIINEKFPSMYNNLFKIKI